MSHSRFRARVRELANPTLPEEVRLTNLNQLLAENLVAVEMTPPEMLRIAFGKPSQYWEMELSRPLPTERLARHLAYHLATSPDFSWLMEGIIVAIWDGIANHRIMFHDAAGARSSNWRGELIATRDAADWLLERYPNFVPDTLATYLEHGGKASG